MKFRAFTYNFHDGHLVTFALGPRRELTLEIALNPVWNRQGPSQVVLRFGGIENFDEVTTYFKNLPPLPVPHGYIAEIIGIRYLGTGPNWVSVDLMGCDHMHIQSRHVIEI